MAKAIIETRNGEEVSPIGESLSNAAAGAMQSPFTVNARIQGVAALLFHRWNNEAVEEKAASSKGSKSRKSDNLESYVYRGPDNEICIPGRYLQRAIVEAARFHQDPRSSRKMAKDLVAAGVLVTPELTPMLINGRRTVEWEYLDRQRVVVQRAGITRVRPAFLAGWEAEFEVASLMPEYISAEFLHRLTSDAGRFVGLADFRPTYGRFIVTGWGLSEG